MRILGLIPARGGSKRLPGKNIRVLGDKPLISWTIVAAKESAVFCDIIVSTDDDAIAEIAQSYGANFLGIRPPHLSSDTASSVDVALYELERYEATFGEVDALLLLQPTSPFRTSKTIKNSVEVFVAGGGQHPVVGLSPASCHPAWCFRCTHDSLEPFLGWESLGGRSQDLEPAWTVNGAIYLISPALLRVAGKFLTPNSIPLMMSDLRERIDIDTESDWRDAEKLLESEKVT